MNKYRWYIIFGIPGIFLYFFLFFNLMGEVEANKKELLSARKKLVLYSSVNSLHNYYLSLEKYLSKRIEAYREFDTVSKGVTHLLSMVDSFNLHTKTVFHSNIRGKENIPYITVEIELTGKYSDLCLFFHELSSEAFRIEKLKITPSPAGPLTSLRVRLFLAGNANK